MRISVKQGIAQMPNSQAFSSTDLAKDIKNSPGIVYPLADAKWQISISSIVDHNKNSRVELAHNEARICNVEENVIKYFKGRCIGYVRDPNVIIKPSIAETFFDIPEKEVGEGYFITDRIPSITKFIEEVKKFWDNCDYKPSTDFIKSENLTRKTFKTTGYNFNYYDDLQDIPKTETVFQKNYTSTESIDSYVNYLNGVFKNMELEYLKNRKEFSSLSIQKAKKYLAKVSDQYLNEKDVFNTFGDTKIALEEDYLDLLLRIENDLISY